ncbi:hypothetical protein DSL72_007079 [Monilinia vaccinii-corymbosi]|uniref:Macro domain-containing protein n=1 Tax=Monilinia vaccinii-corymbosi TaxID=61207 RepID=A0A8A3PKM5_9HELO|nr:hypothetical protein DSL72_007079 [Monilinia vaccinii-corymbosi]
MSTTIPTPITRLPPVSRGLLLSSSSDPLAPLELRLASLLSFPCTAIVSPISQSPSRYPLTHPLNSIKTIPSSPLSSHAPPSTYSPQPSLPGLIDHLAGPGLVRWREEHWPEGLNAGDCGVSPSFGVGGSRDQDQTEDMMMGNGKNGGKNGDGDGDEDHERPQYIIHTHAPNFADKSYSTPLVKQLLANCYYGALVEAVRIAREIGGEEHKGEGEGEQEVDMEEALSTNGNEPHDRSPMDIESTKPIKPKPQLSYQTKTNKPPRKQITIAMPALATGHNGFPTRLAARIAVGTVRDFMRHAVFGAERRRRIGRVVFCVWPVDSPNRKALQIAFGLMFPPPLPQSAPLSPVSSQLATPPFSPRGRKREGFDSGVGGGQIGFGGGVGIGLGLGITVSGRESEVGIPKIVVTSPLSRVCGERERERERKISLGGGRLRMGREGGLGMGGVGKESEGVVREKVAEGNTGKIGKGRKASYRQMKKKQGLRLAAANRAKREIKMKGVMEGGGNGNGNGNGNGATLDHSARLQVEKTNTRTPERMPGVEEGRAEDEL